MKNIIFNKRNLIFSTALMLLMGITAACGNLAEFQSAAQQSYGAGTGMTYIGDYPSESACISACKAKGYTSSYLWGYSTKHCQCK